MMVKPVFVGKEQIMSFYDSVNPDNELAYSLWFNDKPILQYPGGMDGDKARDLLETTIEAYEAAGWDYTLWLKFHPAQKDPIVRKTPTLIAQPIGFIAESDGAISGTNGTIVYRGNGSGMNLEMFRAIKTLDDLPKTVKETIDERFKEYDDRLKAIEQPAKEEPTVMAQISGIVEKHPQIIEAVIGLIKNWTPQLAVPQQPAAALAINGAPNMTEQQPPAEQPQTREIDNDKVNAALDRLELVMVLDDDLTALADFAEKDPEQFKFLLNLLRQKK